MKGPQFLLMAAPRVIQRYADATFVFIGPDHVNYKSHLLRLSEKLGLQDRVIFTGSINDFEMKMQAFAAADIFVLPSGYEGTSQSIFQAMASAKPIIASNRGGIPFQVEDGKEAILVEYGDVEAITSAIIKLLGDNELAISLGSRAKEKVKQFTYPILVNQIEKIYSKLV
jgi:glycosyltransferase involved in cell wall biosynthesis